MSKAQEVGKALRTSVVGSAVADVQGCPETALRWVGCREVVSKGEPACRVGYQGPPCTVIQPGNHICRVCADS